ncbi:hypothetical protein LIER_40009 [Lithospermum erythrorhizon]|uniref:Uncharacterized protein n=1 Tax=Lithospermum erythrorhizon TaxID=34254 RepID=A0AAV3QRD3_LITER
MRHKFLWRQKLVEQPTRVVVENISEAVPLVNESVGEQGIRGEEVEDSIVDKIEVQPTPILEAIVNVKNGFVVLDDDVEDHALIVYGSKNREERKTLWTSLKQAKAHVSFLPWVMGGDFNVIRASSESMGRGSPNYGTIDEFNSCIRETELVEHSRVGGAFSFWLSVLLV